MVQKGWLIYLSGTRSNVDGHVIAVVIFARVAGDGGATTGAAVTDGSMRAEVKVRTQRRWSMKKQTSSDTRLVKKRSLMLVQSKTHA